MALSAEERDRLADVVRLQPTKNAELADAWGMDGGSEVHAYLEDHLSAYYYRDENSYVRATDEAAELVDVEPGVEDGDRDDGVPDVVRGSVLERQVFAVLAGPDERSESVVSVLRTVRDEFDADPTADEVRRALQSLRRSGVVEVEQRLVPTFRRVDGTDDVRVETTETAETA